MKGDFSRNTFRKQNHYSRVLTQQGRVQLDADTNEQTAILLHYLRTLTADLLGPAAGNGFKIATGDRGDFYIGEGNYYVDGILCENEARTTYLTQPDLPPDESTQLNNGNYLVYLDIWERHLNHIEAPAMREVALGGHDTASRAKATWQVKVFGIEAYPTRLKLQNGPAWQDALEEMQPANRGRLVAQARPAEEQDTDDPCIIAPDARYRGPENQLYRVEIHQGGRSGEGQDEATFKWSRENGSVIFPIRSLSGQVVSLDFLGEDNRYSLKPDDWVEIVLQDEQLHGKPGRLAQVDTVDRLNLTVTLQAPPGIEIDEDSDQMPYLRRWDQSGVNDEGASDSGGAIRVSEAGTFYELEDGVQIRFDSYSENEPTYRAGDYWIIPARTATGDIEWPEAADGSGKALLPPHGISHHYALLAIIQVEAGVLNTTASRDCRNIIERALEG